MGVRLGRRGRRSTTTCRIEQASRPKAEAEAEVWAEAGGRDGWEARVCKWVEDKDAEGDGKLKKLLHMDMWWH
jgi:hypothetical protein